MADETGIDRYISSILSKAKDILQNKGVASAIASIAGDYYEKLFAKQHWLLAVLTSESTETDLVLTSYFLELVGVKLLSIPKLRKEAQDILQYGAQIFEYVAKYLAKSKITRIELQKHAAICYDCSGYSGSSVVMAKIAIKEYQTQDDLFVDQSIPEIDNFTHKLHLLILLLLSRKFDEIQALCKSIINNSIAVENEIKSYQDIEEQRFALVKFICGREMLFGINAFSDFILNGNKDAYKESQEALTRSIDISFNIDDAESYAITSLLSIVMQKIYERSVWVILPQHMKNSERYIHLLTSSDSPVIELWESQLQAIEKGLLSHKNNRPVVSMPTSAGKTLTAELAIVDSLTTNQNTTCIYITPSRALALQVEDDLRKRLPKLGFKVSRLAGSYDCPEIESLKLKNCSVLVTTPEKLNLLMKKNLPIVLDCNLFVFDEAQSLQGDNRGIHLEMLLVRLRYLFPERKMLLLSAVMNNAEQIANWIGEDEGCTIDLEWHPTRTLQAIYNDGVVQYYEPLKKLRIDLPPSKAKTIADKVKHVVQSYKKIGSILIFCYSKSVAEQTAERLYDSGITFEKSTRALPYRELTIGLLLPD